MLKILLAGCGRISSAWLSAVKDADDLQTCAVVDIDKRRAQDAAKSFGLSGAIVSKDLHEALRETRPDIVFNCTIPEAHFDTTSACLKAGCHVFSEKPMANEMDQALKLCKISRKSGRVLAVMQNRRFLPQMLAAKKYLEKGALGRLTTLNSDFYVGGFNFEGFRRQMRHVLLLDMAIHTFDSARFLSGCEPLSVYCKEWNPEESWFSHDASASAVFEMSEKMVYTYRGSWTSAGMNTSWESAWRIIGSSGSAVWDGGIKLKAETLKKIPPGEEDKLSREILLDEPSQDAPASSGHKLAILDFIESIKNGRLPQTHAEDNINSLAMVFSAIESSEKGNKIRIRTV